MKWHNNFFKIKLPLKYNKKKIINIILKSGFYCIIIIFKFGMLVFIFFLKKKKSRCIGPQKETDQKICLK